MEENKNANYKTAQILGDFVTVMHSMITKDRYRVQAYVSGTYDYSRCDVYIELMKERDTYSSYFMNAEDIIRKYAR